MPLNIVSKDDNSMNDSALLLTPPGTKPIRVTRARDARRLLSRIIISFQKGEISNQNSKDLAYLLSVFIQIHSATDIEDRIKKLEEKS